MKQVIVMRTDLPGMATGKMCAQAAHASLGAVLPYLRPQSTSVGDWGRNRPKIDAWLAGSFTKVVLRVDSLDKLQDLHSAAVKAGLITCLITDAGRTVFRGEPTVTCCAIGPDANGAIDAITGGLRPL